MSRVLLIQPFLHRFGVSPRAGGKDRACAVWVEALLAKGHEVGVFPWTEALHEDAEFFPGGADGRFVKVFATARPQGRPSDPTTDTQRAALRQAIERAKPDVIHNQYTLLRVVPELRDAGHAGPVFLHHHSDPPCAWAAEYDAVAFPTRYQRERVFPADQGGPALPTTLVPYPLPEGVAGRPLSTRTGRMLFVGLLHNDRKGVDLLLEAMRIEPELNAVGLDVVGEGRSRPRYEALANQHGLDVRFLGYLDDRRIQARLDDARVLTLPSRGESFGMVFIEALARGVPVTGYAPTVDELTEDLGRYVGEPFDALTQDAGQLAQALLATLNNAGSHSDAFNAEAVSRGVAEAFSTERFTSPLFAAYERLW